VNGDFGTFINLILISELLSGFFVRIAGSSGNLGISGKALPYSAHFAMADIQFSFGEREAVGCCHGVGLF
jgi:hypothetical protein